MVVQFHACLGSHLPLNLLNGFSVQSFNVYLLSKDCSCILLYSGHSVSIQPGWLGPDETYCSRPVSFHNGVDENF